MLARREERSSERSGREEQEVIMDETIGKKQYESLTVTAKEVEVTTSEEEDEQ